MSTYGVLFVQRLKCMLLRRGGSYEARSASAHGSLVLFLECLHCAGFLRSGRAHRFLGGPETPARGLVVRGGPSEATRCQEENQAESGTNSRKEARSKKGVPFDEVVREFSPARKKLGFLRVRSGVLDFERRPKPGRHPLVGFPRTHWEWISKNALGA